MTVALIAILHMVPILLTGMATLNLKYVRIVSVVMAVIAIAFGGAMFTVTDLLAVFAAYLLAARWCKPAGRAL